MKIITSISLNGIVRRVDLERIILPDNANNTSLKSKAGIESILDPSNVYELSTELLKTSVERAFFNDMLLKQNYHDMKLYPFIERFASDYNVIKLVNSKGWEISYVPVEISLEIAYFIQQNNTIYPIFYLIESKDLDGYKNFKLRFRLQEWESREKLEEELNNALSQVKKHRSYIRAKEDNNEILFKLFKKANNIKSPHESIAIYQRILEEGIFPIDYVDTGKIHHKLHLLYLGLEEYELAIYEAEEVLEYLIKCKHTSNICDIELAQRRIDKTIAKMDKYKTSHKYIDPSLEEQIEYRRRAEQALYDYNYQHICSYENFVMNDKPVELENKKYLMYENTNPKDFIALDFETANAKRTSACAIGLVFVRGGKITHTEHYYIKPTPNYYDHAISQKHGITSKDTADQPTFIELWKSTLKNKLSGELIVCHNASFDMSVLRALMCEFNIIINRIDYLCTLVLSKMHILGLCNYQLPTVSQYLGYNTFKHHDAAADAEAAAYIFIEICKQLECNDYRRLSKYIKINTGVIYDHDSYSSCSGIRLNSIDTSNSCAENYDDDLSCYKESQIHNTQDLRAEIKEVLRPNFETVEDTDNPFFKKRIVITGTFLNFPDRIELQKLLKFLGADINTTVSAKTDLVIFGQSPGWSKMSKVEQYNVKSISESQLIESYSKYIHI